MITWLLILAPVLALVLAALSSWLAFRFGCRYGQLEARARHALHHLEISREVRPHFAGGRS